MNTKERHYWAQLRAALTAGQWRTHFPAKAPNGAPLSWSELFRKFKKHCRGAQDVANVASHTYTLALSISEDSPNEDEDSDGSTLGIDTECLISQGKVEKIEAGYEELQSLQSSNLDMIHFALAYYAYALGNPAQCIAHLEKVPDIYQVRSHLPTSLGATFSSTNLSTTQIAPSITSSFTPSFASVADSTVPEVRDGRGLAMVESFRSICLQGMALEHLHPTSPSIALQTYCSVLPHLFPSLKSQFPHVSLLPNLSHQNHKLSSSPSSKLDFTVFHQLRELWRWVERIIWRAVVLCANIYDVRKGWKGDENSDSTVQQGEEGDSLWIWLSHYTHYSAYWPSTFRTSHRSTISSIHIRALILLHRPSPSSSLSIPSSPSSLYPLLPSSLPKSLQKSPPVWLNQARQVIQDYQAILGVSTAFPRAGTRNVKVEDFVDLCVAVWEVYVFGGGRGEVGWVIDVLWWATRLTFNSSRILRHMTRLLYLYGNTKLAKRTLNLYIQVVGKAYETSGHRSDSDLGSSSDTDTDSNWVDTLIFGATMLCTSSSFSSSSHLAEMDDLNEAHKIIEKAKTRLNKQDKRLAAKMYLAEGVYWMMLGVKDQDPLAKQTHLSLSHSLLLQSVQTDPTPSGYYHFALSYAIPGGATVAAAQGFTRTTSNNTDSSDSRYNLEQAIQYSGLAVEADPGDVKYWHLLGLLLAAEERWEEAREVLEKGADLGVGEDDADVEVSGESGEVGGLPSFGMGKGDEEGNDTVDSVQSDADVRTLLGPPIFRISTPNGDSSTITPAIKTDGVEDISINRVSPITSTNPPQPIYIFSQSQSSSSITFTTQSLPPTSTLLLSPPPSKYPPSQYDLFESHLQLRMTLGTVVEIVEGAEGAEALWLEVFGWVAKGRGAEDGLQRQSIDGITQRSSDHISSSHHHTITTSIDGSPHHSLPNPNSNLVAHHHNQQPQQTSYSTDNTEMYQTQAPAIGSSDLETNGMIHDLIPITISPATPTVAEVASSALEIGKDREKEKDQRKDLGKEKKTLNNAFRPKRLASIDVERDSNNRLDVQKSKKNVGQMLKGSVMKSRAGITAATKKLGVRHSGLRRSTSTPDFHVVFQQSTSYQASSIHSRRRLSFMSASRDRPLESPPPPPLSTTTTTTTHQPSSSPISTSVFGHHQQDLKSERSMKDRLLSDLWLMSAATFRRLGKIDQAKGAIQEAEVKDENNPAVWVQFGLYYISIGLYQHAVDTFQKALFICPDDVAATVHLSRLYLDPDLNACLHSSTNQSSSTKPTTTTTTTATTATTSSSEGEPTTTDSSNPSTPLLYNSDVDLAAGMLSYLTKGKGWNVPEAWYYLAKAYGLQGRKEKEKEILSLALELSERRGVRDIGSALGWCYL